MKKFVAIVALCFAINSFANSDQDHKEKGASPAKAGHGKKEKGVSSAKAMGYLKKGNARYLADDLRHEGQDQRSRLKLKDGQKPHTIIISCADSRVPPELIFDQKLGEIFTIRVAGEQLDHAVLASMEYAVEHLGVKNVFIMGHSSCGAVKAAISTKEGTSAGSEHLDALVADIRPRVKNDRAPASEPSPGVEIESAANAEKVASDIPKRSAIMKAALESKGVEIHWGLYHIDTGLVDFH